jgi:hypothetical protein
VQGLPRCQSRADTGELVIAAVCARGRVENSSDNHTLGLWIHRKKAFAMPKPIGQSQESQEGAAVMKNGFKVVDSDIHLIEPADLWQR